MHTSICIHYSLIGRLASYKVYLCFIVLSVTVCTVGYICVFRGDQIVVDFVSFLSMIIYEVLYTWCLRYNICSAWFLRYKNINLFHAGNISLLAPFCYLMVQNHHISCCLLFLSRQAVVSCKAKKKQHACTSVGLCDHYSELFTRMAALRL